MLRLAPLRQLIIVFTMLFALQNTTFGQTAEIQKVVEEIRDRAEIPGIVITIVRGDETYFLPFGYADLEAKTLVDKNSLFELGSLSKAFTALALMKLVEQGKIDLEAEVTDYLPWFKVQFEEEPQIILVRHFLYHSSGIPWSTIADIPISGEKDALERTVRILEGQELAHKPGEYYEYATTNYDVLALIMQEVSGEPFEQFMQREVIEALDLKATTIGLPHDPQSMVTGYKKHFFNPVPYDAPVFRGNYAAGYVISNAEDMASWIRIQLGLQHSTLDSLITVSHARDMTVPVHGQASYAKGWEVSLRGDQRIFHYGRNPNFSTHISLFPEEQMGIAILSNSSNTAVREIAYNVINILQENDIEDEPFRGRKDDPDQAYSVVSIILGLYLLVMVLFLGKIVYDISDGRRTFQPINRKQVVKDLLSLLLIVPILIATYFLPFAMKGFNWDAIFIWLPFSFRTMIMMIFFSVGISYLVFFVARLFPDKNELYNEMPKVALFSIVTGIANMVIIFLITSSLGENIKIQYLIAYFLFSVGIYIGFRKYVQTKMFVVTQNLIYRIRVKLVERILSTTYENFEKIKQGRVYSTLNEDATIIANSTILIVSLVRNSITIGGAFLYMATIDVLATLSILFVMMTLTIFYFFVSRTANTKLEQARDTRDEFMQQVQGLVLGFKELSLHRGKKTVFNQEVGNTLGVFRTKVVSAHIGFINAFLIGESSLIMVLGTIAIALPVIVPSLEIYVITSFVIIILYLIGPINEILNAAPTLVQLRVSWRRIQQFTKELPPQSDSALIASERPTAVEELHLDQISFEYPPENGGSSFRVGPIDMTIKRGEALFIIGGNGSGKTTLAKLLMGLYEGDGKILVDGEQVDDLGNYYSAVFNPMYLFDKLYDTPLEGREGEINDYLKLLGLSDKVTVKGDAFSTTSLSTGQRKRLALLLCYLENRPIYLFDEWAADQDPEYRKFFYQQLLPEMKAKGKIVIAITHDDHYFHLADKVLKLELGQISSVKNNFEAEALITSVD